MKKIISCFLTAILTCALCINPCYATGTPTMGTLHDSGNVGGGLSFVWRNGYAYTQLGYFLADCESWMWMKNLTSEVSSRTIGAQALIVKGTRTGETSTNYGPYKINSTTNPAYNAMESYLLLEIKYGEGAYAKGTGFYIKPDATKVYVTTESNTLGTLDDYGWLLSNDNELDFDSTGASYGVPCDLDNGESYIPDMLRTEYANNKIGYISKLDIESAATFNASTSKDFNDAYNKIVDSTKVAVREAMRRYLGEYLLQENIENGIVDDLIYKSSTKEVTNDIKATLKISSTLSPADFSILSKAEDSNLDSKIEEIIAYVRESTKFSVPVYDFGGTAVISYFDMYRI
jgi:hypothetical protein